MPALGLPLRRALLHHRGVGAQQLAARSGERRDRSPPRHALGARRARGRRRCCRSGRSRVSSLRRLSRLLRLLPTSLHCGVCGLSPAPKGVGERYIGILQGENAPSEGVPRVSCGAWAVRGPPGAGTWVGTARTVWLRCAVVRPGGEDEDAAEEGTELKHRVLEVHGRYPEAGGEHIAQIPCLAVVRLAGAAVVVAALRVQNLAHVPGFLARELGRGGCKREVLPPRALQGGAANLVDVECVSGAGLETIDLSNDADAARLVVEAGESHGVGRVRVEVRDRDLCRPVGRTLGGGGRHGGARPCEEGSISQARVPGRLAGPNAL